MSVEKKEASVSRISESVVKREQQGVFQYTLAKRQVAPSYTIAAGVIIVSLGVLLILQEKPTRESKAFQRPTFSLPTMTQAQKAPGPDLSSYDRADDAKARQDKKKQQPSTHSKVGTRKALAGPILILPHRDMKIPLGTTLKAVLVSGGANGWIKAAVKSAFVQNGETLIEAGNILMGRGSSSEDRLYIQFTKLIRRDGTMDAIEAEAADPSDESPGLKGSRLGSRATKLAASIGLNFITGAAEALQDSQGQQGVVIRAPSARNAILQGTARASLDESQEVLHEMRNSHPEIAVSVGTEILVTFVGDSHS